MSSNAAFGAAGSGAANLVGKAAQAASKSKYVNHNVSLFFDVKTVNIRGSDHLTNPTHDFEGFANSQFELHIEIPSEGDATGTASGRLWGRAENNNWYFWHPLYVGTTKIGQGGNSSYDVAYPAEYDPLTQEPSRPGSSTWQEDIQAKSLDDQNYGDWLWQQGERFADTAQYFGSTYVEYLGIQTQTWGETIVEVGAEGGDFVGDHLSKLYYDPAEEWQRIKEGTVATASAAGALAEFGVKAYLNPAQAAKDAAPLVQQAGSATVDYLDKLTSDPRTSGKLLAHGTIAWANAGQGAATGKLAGKVLGNLKRWASKLRKVPDGPKPKPIQPVKAKVESSNVACFVAGTSVLGHSSPTSPESTSYALVTANDASRLNHTTLALCATTVAIAGWGIGALHPQDARTASRRHRRVHKRTWNRVVSDENE